MQRWYIVLALSVLSALGTLGGPQNGSLKAAVAPATPVTPVTNDFAKRIDQLLLQSWEKARVQPARSADDAEFVRRVYLDLAGRIPAVSEVREFLGDKRADRRARLIEKLLSSPRYSQHFSTVYRALLIPEASNDLQVRSQIPGFERWLRDKLKDNVGYDSLVRELLTVPLERNRSFDFEVGSGPFTFYQAKEFQPTELASTTARVFLGVNLGCAQCHNHPFATWEREQFWNLAAFFAGIRARREGDFTVFQGENSGVRQISLPNSERKVSAHFLDGQAPKFKNGVSSRVVLAEWITSPSNPYFARASVNRVWAYLFGTGLIEPIDEMLGSENRSHQPEILDELAREFIANKFDLKWLLRTLTSTQAYQLTSARSLPKGSSQDDPRHFARMPLRGLRPEQLYDSILQATGQLDRRVNPNEDFFLNETSDRANLIQRFNNDSDRAVDVQTSILQALTLMNGRLISSATRLESSDLLTAICEAPFLDTAGRIETLYLAALSRLPRPAEKTRMMTYVEKRGSAGPSKNADEDNRRHREALADVLWVLLNSSEFLFNH